MRRVLYVGKPSKIYDKILSKEGIVMALGPDAEITHGHMMEHDILVSYGYRHRVRSPRLLPCINVHISLLPYNRGCDPNYWSYADDTPKGGTIHYMDEEFDTGDIILQEEFNLRGVTLSQTYNDLSDKTEKLFVDNYDYIMSLPKGTPQSGEGTYHSKGEMPSLENGYDTLVKNIAPSR